VIAFKVLSDSIINLEILALDSTIISTQLATTLSSTLHGAKSTTMLVTLSLDSLITASLVSSWAIEAGSVQLRSLH
jgi:hypothetical protein